MIGVQWMMWLDIEQLGQQEYEDVWEFAQDKSNISLRYIAALSIIANLVNDLDQQLLPNDENVDLSICKMIMDGAIEIETLSDSIH